MDKNIIRLKKDKNGKYYIKLYGVKWEIILEDEKNINRLQTRR